MKVRAVDTHSFLEELGVPFFAMGFPTEIYDAPCNNLGSLGRLEMIREDARRDKEQSFRYYQKWLETRTADINFVIDTILANSADHMDGVYALADGARIGVMAHSLGGSAALAIPCQRDDIKAVIGIESPFLLDFVGVENGKFVWTDAIYPVPVLNIYSDASWTHLSEWSQYAKNEACF